MPGPLSAPNGRYGLVDFPKERRESNARGQLVTGKTAVKRGFALSWRDKKRAAEKKAKSEQGD